MRAKANTYIEFGFQSCKVVLEQVFDLAPGCLPTWNVNTILCTRSDIDHLLELGVFEGLDRL
jgi:hypothetical protein